MVERGTVERSGRDKADRFRRNEENLTLLPHDKEAEQGVLGAIILANGALLETRELLRPEHFFSAGHRSIFQAMLDVHDGGQPVDEVTIARHLRAQHRLDSCGGIAYIAELVDLTPVASNVLVYARIVLETHRLRTLIETGLELAQRGRESLVDVDGLIARARDVIADLAKGNRVPLRARHAKLALAEFMEELVTRPKDAFVAKTCTALDSALGGISSERPMYVAARTGVGKTIFAMQTAVRNARAGVPSLFISLEHRDTTLMARAASALGAVGGAKMLHRRVDDFSEQDWDRLGEAAELVEGLPLFIVRPPHAVTVPEIQALIQHHVAQDGIKFVVLDHLARIKTGKGSIYEQATARANDVAAMVSELALPLLVLVQINREGAERPSLLHLKGSGEIEETASAVVILHDPEPENSDPHEIEVAIAKNDSGPCVVKQMTKYGWKFTIE